MKILRNIILLTFAFLAMKSISINAVTSEEVYKSMRDRALSTYNEAQGYYNEVIKAEELERLLPRGMKSTALSKPLREKKLQQASDILNGWIHDIEHRVSKIRLTILFLLMRQKGRLMFYRWPNHCITWSILI